MDAPGSSAPPTSAAINQTLGVQMVLLASSHGPSIPSTLPRHPPTNDNHLLHSEK